MIFNSHSQRRISHTFHLSHNTTQTKKVSSTSQTQIITTTVVVSTQVLMDHSSKISNIQTTVQRKWSLQIPILNKDKSRFKKVNRGRSRKLPWKMIWVNLSITTKAEAVKIEVSAPAKETSTKETPSQVSVSKATHHSRRNSEEPNLSLVKLRS